MRCFLVRGGSRRRTINLHQHEAGRIDLLLDDIESRDAWLANAGTRVGQRRDFERFNTLRLHPNMNVNNEHGVGP